MNKFSKWLRIEYGRLAKSGGANTALLKAAEEIDRLEKSTIEEGRLAVRVGYGESEPVPNDAMERRGELARHVIDYIDRLEAAIAQNEHS